jgi:hypothetical protein
MPISGNISRPKLSTDTTVAIEIDTKAITVSGNKINLPVVLNDLATSTFTVANCTTVNSNTTVNSTVGAFSNVRAGDSVSGTGIPGGAKVQSVATNGSSFVLSAAATAGGTVTLTFDPGTIDATLYILSIDHSISGSQIRVVPTLYQFDGSQARDGGSGYDAATTATAGSTAVDLSTITINLDTYLAKARKPRTNS